MITVLHRSRRLLCVTVVATLPLLAACAGEKPPVEKPAGTITVDRALHDSLPEEIRSKGVIRVAGGSSSYPPLWEFAEDKRTRVGFEPDLADALGKVLGVRFEILGGAFAEHLDRLERHEVDVVLDSMTDNAKREQKADFVNYFTAGTAIVVRRGNPDAVTAIDDLCGRVVAVPIATVQEDLAKRAQKACKDRPLVITVTNEPAEALVQLRTGRATAVMVDYPPAVSVSTDPATRGHFQLASNTQYEPSPYGIGVAKDRTQLREAIKQALNRLIQSGVYTELTKRWNLADGQIRSATINGGGAGPG
jgi:polar amino acid transport system substrate-binding protein